MNNNDVVTFVASPSLATREQLFNGEMDVVSLVELRGPSTVRALGYELKFPDIKKALTDLQKRGLVTISSARTPWQCTKCGTINTSPVSDPRTVTCKKCNARLVVTSRHIDGTLMVR